ncbi:Wd-40 repeat protein [Mycena sanguinolenta]|uniref:Wd-40 repeat protein n=1 Tax=Mycena sanguinolenta TaxID=230812 RepID=A0A8H6YFT0_9AGAR|nr:Wd-40 repeat protein [Mycena sanguinolenta]
MACLSSPDFIPRWQYSLSAEFQQNGVPAGSEPWVTEATKFAVGGEPASWCSAPTELRSRRAWAPKSTCFTVDNLEFHPRGRRLAASYTRRSPPPLQSLVRVWDLDAAPDLRDEDGLAGAAKEVVAAASPTLLQRWSAAGLSGTLPSFVARVFSHDGRSLLYLPDCKTVTVVDAATLTERFQLSGHTDAIMWAETSPNDKVVATSSWDRTVRIWSMESGEALRILSRADGQSWAGAFSPDGDVIAAGAGDGIVRIWGVDAGQLLFTFSGFGGWVRSLAFSPNGLQLAAGSGGGSLRIIDLKSWECVQSWQIDVNKTGRALAGPFLEIVGVQYTSRGDLFFCASDGHMVGYRPSQNLKWDFLRPSLANGIWFKTFAISKDGSKLISSLGSNVGIWKIH